METLANKVDKIDIVRYEFTYTGDYEKFSNSLYYKDALGFVTGHFSATRVSGKIQDGDITAVLPIGFRPVEFISFPSTFHHGFLPGLLNIGTGGTISVRADITTQITVYSYFRFYAGT